MLNFKDFSRNILSKILFGFLVLSFVLFGISSFLLQDSNNWVAKIDGRKISQQKLQQLVNQEKRLILDRNPGNQNVLNYINSAKFNIDVLGKLVSERLIETLSTRYGVYPDRMEILKNITQNPNFHKDGKFDHKFFKNILANNGIDEEEYIKMVSNETINTMVLNSITLVSPIDNVSAIKIAQLEEEIRYADLLTISNHNIQKIAKPTDENLQQVYEENKNQFQEPEKRNIQYIAFDRSILARGIYITNKQVKEFYEANKEKFKTKQTRSFYHVLFDKRSDAENFLEKLNQSRNKEASFVELGELLAKKSNKQLLIKNITDNDSIPEVAQTVFSLNLNQNSEIFESDLGYHIALLKEINEGQFLSFQTVKKEIKKQLQEKLVEKTIQEKIEAINESILSNNSLDKAAKQFRLGRVNQINNFTFSSNENENVLAKKARKLNGFAENSFKVELSKTSSLMESNNELYAVLVTKSTKARLKEFKEVRRELSSIYYKEKTEEELANLAKEISDIVRKDPNSIRTVARKYNIKIARNQKFHKTKKVKIQDKEYEISTDFLKDLFQIKEGQSTSHHKTDDGKSYQIAILKETKIPKLSPIQLNKYRSQLSDSYRREFVETFNKYIEKEHNLVINQKFIESIQKQSANEL